MTQPPTEAAHDQLGELQALLDATVDAVVLIDHRGHIESFNRSGERLFGYRADELIGRNVSILMTGRDSDSHDAYMSRYMKTGVAHIIGVGREVDARRKDGSVFPAVLSVGRVRDSDPPRFVGLLHDITLRREAMAALRRERDRANLYLEVAQVILVALSADGRVQLINRKGCETLGRREIDLLGHDWIDTAVPQQQRAEARSHLAALARREAHGDRYVEYQVTTAAGPRRLVAWRCVALRDAQDELLGFLCSGEDITERRSIEQSMERTQSLLNEAQEIANFGNFEVYHPPTGEAFWSPQLFRIFGLEPSNDIPNAERLASELIHPEDLEPFAADWNAARSAPGNRSGAYRILTTAGEVRHVQITSSSTPWQGERMRIAGTVLDVTEATRAAEQAREAQQRMTHVSRLATMGEMAAGIAHELNQPLAAIANYASAAARLTATPHDSMEDIKLSLQQIAGQALRAGEIIRRLRSLVQNRETRREPADVNDLVAEVVSFSQSDARLNDVQIRHDAAAGLPVLSIDRIQIQQILLNLVRNAIEAMAEVPPHSRLITVATELDGDEAVLIRVSDTGPGVPAALVAKIFDPFCTTKESGTGLGLAISRTIAEAHQGKLQYQQAPEGGACFILRLPSPPRRKKNES